MPHEEIHRELSECRVSGEFVAYHKWGDNPSIFLVGVVRELSPTKVVFQDVDSRGQFERDEHAVPLRLIHTVERGTLYLQRLRVLHELGPIEIPAPEARTPAEVRALLEEAARDGVIVKLWTSVRDEEDVRVLSVGDETASVSSVFDAGRPNGRAVIRLKRIVRVRWGRSEADDDRVHRHWVEHGFPDAVR